ncbi:carboxyvinyl-carboxyphosphonate phosphorylmutase [Methylobacterium mesophilicum SR1.6/6]|uniref:Carboxyvinyl-carboxyphosphonate phosphorylmutase n=2 Tax=Methylobacterium mesophilicum TaxID=39956 RepID=A0A6B9G3B0_9HYPH|nr:carboxyvinyl-carboxyphosphonate phosphorylmutase [Methylobacterium mesophilicum SR1.6/6]
MRFSAKPEGHAVTFDNHTATSLSTDDARATTRLKRIVSRRDATLLAGAPNALFARLIEDLGFEAVYLSGAGIANMNFGIPDVGLTTLTEVCTTLSAVAEVVNIPIVVDADTGFGNPVNMTRTIRLLERAGAAGIQIEDQVFPKKCGHFSGKDVIPLPEMLQKLRAALDTRRDGDLQIIARTDAYATLGFQAALDRAAAFAEAGADVIFLEAPTHETELLQIPRAIDAPHIVNIVFGGLTPAVPQAQLREAGFSLVLYANATLQAALRGAREVLEALARDGSLDAVSHRIATFDERQTVVRKPEFDALDTRYRT